MKKNTRNIVIAVVFLVAVVAAVGITGRVVAGSAGAFFKVPFIN